MTLEKNVFSVVKSCESSDYEVLAHSNAYDLEIKSLHYIFQA